MAHEHHHDPVRFSRAEVADETLTAIRALHPALADNLLLARRFGELEENEKTALLEAQRAIEKHEAWTPGYHAKGDVCITCASPTSPIFEDVFAHGKLAYAAFVNDLPVHARKECLDGAPAKIGRPSPQALDRLRRAHVVEGSRPSARVAMFFRHDVLAHPPFELEDWANSVAEANPGGLSRGTMKDIERLLSWAHARLYH